MSNTIVTIHYQDGTQWELDAAGNIQTTGGEGELQGDQLIGLSRVIYSDGLEIGPQGPPESFDPENWVDADELVSEGADNVIHFHGWFPVFRTENREWIYTWSGAVDRVEVTVR